MSSRGEIAASAATWIVEHGLDYASACRKAAEHLGYRGCAAFRCRTIWKSKMPCVSI
jgi:hypothetical protein